MRCESGTKHAPSHWQPQYSSTVSGSFASTHATRSPRSTPRAASPAAIRAARSRRSAYVSRSSLADERLRVRRPLGRVEEAEREVHASGDLRDRVDDRRVARAAAELAGEHVDDLLARRRPLAREQVVGRDEDARRAEAALERVVAAERLLERCERAAAGETLDRDDLGAVDLRGEQEARAHGDAVEPHRARAADAVLAADVCPGEAETVAEEVREEEPRLDVLAVAAAVDRDVDRDHAAARWRARATARSTRTRTSCFRYAGRRVDRSPRLDLGGGGLAGVLRIDLEHRRRRRDRADDDADRRRRGRARRPCRARSRRRAARAPRTRIRRRRPAGASTVSTTSSSGASAVVYGPRKKLVGGDLALATQRPSDRPSLRAATRQSGSSAAGSACATEPHDRAAVARDEVADVGEGLREERMLAQAGDPPGGRGADDAARRSRRTRRRARRRG